METLTALFVVNAIYGNVFDVTIGSDMHLCSSEYSEAYDVQIVHNGDMLFCINQSALLHLDTENLALSE